MVWNDPERARLSGRSDDSAAHLRPLRSRHRSVPL